jgi:hypothetical protein
MYVRVLYCIADYVHDTVRIYSMLEMGAVKRSPFHVALWGNINSQTWDHQHHNLNRTCVYVANMYSYTYMATVRLPRIGRPDRDLIDNALLQLAPSYSCMMSDISFGYSYIYSNVDVD